MNIVHLHYNGLLNTDCKRKLMSTRDLGPAHAFNTRVFGDTYPNHIRLLRGRFRGEKPGAKALGISVDFVHQRGVKHSLL
jgi:hypothetical protein